MYADRDGMSMFRGGARGAGGARSGGAGRCLRRCLATHPQKRTDLAGESFRRGA
jgi:hypothetical protein